MNRNIITPRDLQERPSDSSDAAKQQEDLFRRLEKGLRPASDNQSVIDIRPVPMFNAPLAPTDRKPDSWYERILKFIPVEAVGMYLALDGLIRSATLDSIAKRVWLSIALLVALLFTLVYLKRVAKVTRTAQIAASGVALVTWVFALGGVFSTFPFYAPWEGTAALVVVTAFLGVWQLDSN